MYPSNISVNAIKKQQQPYRYVTNRKMNRIELHTGSTLVGATAPKIRQMNMCKMHEICCSVYMSAKYRSRK